MNVTQQCRCTPMLIFGAWATCGFAHKKNTFIISGNSGDFCDISSLLNRLNHGERWRAALKHNSSTGRKTKYLRKNNVWDLKNDEILDSFRAKMIKSESALKNWATIFNIWKKWWTGLSRNLLTNISHDAFGTDSRIAGAGARLQRRERAFYRHGFCQENL